jgi:hypothetical protein
MSFLGLKPAELRAPEALTLPDNRKRLTRFFRVAHIGVLPPELNFGWGTEDTGEAPNGWEGLRLVGRRLDDDFPLPGRSDTRPVAILTYEQIDEDEETRVGSDITSQNDDGGVDIIQEWVQFSSATYVPKVVSTDTAVGNATAFLQKEESADDGTVRRIKRYYTTVGITATDFQTKHDGKLLIQIITSVRTVPSTPAGYTLIGEPTQHPDGLPIYTYTFAKGNGEISRETRYSQSSDQGTTGVSITTIRHLTASSVGSDPTSAPSGTVKIGADQSDQDGYRVWTVTYAKGTGEVSRDIDYSQSTNQGTTGITRTVIQHLTATSVSTDPTTPPSGQVKISESKRDADGYRVWTITYAKGTGTVGLTTYTREDGSIVYEVSDLGTASATPSYPGSGTAYLVRLTNNISSGHYLNSATWIKPPASVGYRRQIKFQMPGLAYFSGTDLILQPPTVQDLLGTVTVSFGTTQDTTTPFKISQWAAFTETYTPTATGIPVTAQYGLNGYLASGVTISGSGTYKGVATDAYSAQRFASTPSTLPTGSTVLNVDNDPYLMAIDGTVVFKRSVTTATL